MARRFVSLTEQGIEKLLDDIKGTEKPKKPQDKVGGRHKIGDAITWEKKPTLDDLFSVLQSHQRALVITRRGFGAKHSRTADNYESLGKTQQALGDSPSALQSHQRALDIRLKLFGEDHSSTADSYKSLGQTQHALGDFPSALQSHQHALDIRRKLFGKDHSSTAGSYKSLGQTQQALGDFSSALQSHQHALDIRRKLFGEDHSSTADSYKSLGQTQHALGDFPSALQSHQHALDIRRKLFGKNHSSTAGSYKSLGQTQQSLGDFSSALQSHQRALDIRRKLFGEEQSSTADSYESLGQTQQALGIFSSALQSHQRALDIRRKLFGKNHSSTADSYESLGKTQHALGDFSSAIQPHQRALDIRLKLFGEEHSSTADSYESLGKTQHALGDFYFALLTHQRALDIRRTLFGENHSSTANSYNSLGKTQHALGDFSSAIQSHQRALVIKRKFFGYEHSSTANSYKALGQTQQALGDFSSALQSHQRALDIRLKLFGEEHSSTADSYKSLGQTQQALGDFSSALQSHQRALDIRLKLFGEEHSSTADSYKSLGQTQQALGDFSSALQSYQRAIDIRLKLFGQDHSSTAETSQLLILLGQTQEALGDFISAFQSRQRAIHIRLKGGKNHPSTTADSYHSLGATQLDFGDSTSALQSSQGAQDIGLNVLGGRSREVGRDRFRNSPEVVQPEVSNLSSVPLDILTKGPKTVEIYNKALKDGKTFIKRVPVMFIGQERTGKTSLKKSLKGDTFDPMETSTEGIETADPSYFKVSREVWSTGKKNEEIDSGAALSFEHHAARFISAQLREGKANPEDVGESFASSHTEECNPNTASSTDSTFTKETSTNPGLPVIPAESKEENDADVLAQQPPEPQLPKPPLSEPQSPQPQLPDDIAELIPNLLQKVETEEDEEEDIYSILWDFGGQSVYYTTHPIFLTEKAIYILACDLSRNPHNKANTPIRKGLYKNNEDRKCSKTNLDYLEFWMSSVYSLVNPDALCQEVTLCEGSSTRLPPVFLVCTHADQPYCSVNNPRELALEIFGSLQDKIYSKHLHEDVFVVDNTKSGSGQECSEIVRLKQELHEVAQKLPQMKEAIPLKWLKYEKELKEMCMQESFKWISLSQARQIALEVCQITDEDELHTLLNFLHDQRILVHFNGTPELDKMVVLDPQWLIDVFKKVITVKPYDPKEKTFKELWLKLEKTGILDAELLDHVWNPLFDNKETRESLVAIMERFSLLCPWPSSDDSKQYLVPSMLMSPPTDEALKRSISVQLPSLFVKFESGRVPPGLFPRLVLQFFQWSNEEWKHQMDPELFQNFAMFHIRPVEGISITLLCHPSSIEVSVNSENVLEVNADLSHGSSDVIMTTTRTIRRHLGLILECMRNEFFWLKNMKFKMCVCCPVCSPTGSVTYCRTHHVEGCKQDECLHFWLESELRECQQQFVICKKPGIRGVPKIQVNQFALWFTIEDGQQNRNAGNQVSLYKNRSPRVT
ncbi:hypothetical protein ACROYT_G020535 [Oculina patagonica]